MFLRSWQKIITNKTKNPVVVTIFLVRTCSSTVMHAQKIPFPHPLHIQLETKLKTCVVDTAEAAVAAAENVLLRTYPAARPSRAALLKMPVANSDSSWQRDSHRPESLCKYYLDIPFLKIQKTNCVFITKMKCSC